MNNNNYKNENNGQRFQLTTPNRQFKNKPNLYEQSITTTTTTITNQETNTKTDETTTTQLEKSPLRRVNLVTGPRSAFARLFPEKYQQEQEESARQQRSKSTSIDDQRYNFDRYKSNDDDDDHRYDALRKSRRVKFYDQKNDVDSSYPTTFTPQTKSETSLHQDISQIPLNYDPDPEIIYRDNPNKVVYVQKVGVRYLKPPTPPPPEPIIIRERHATPSEEPPPLIVSTSPPISPKTPSPIIVREEPPPPPEHLPTKIITKTLPPPSASARRVIIKRIPPLPAKPRPVIIEKWLPYKQPPERPILYERAEQLETDRPSQHNVILQYEPARVRIEQEIQNAGCFRVDPELYRAEFGSQLRRTDSIRRVLQDIGCDPEIITSTGYNTCYPTEETRTDVSQNKNQVYSNS